MLLELFVTPRLNRSCAIDQQKKPAPGTRGTGDRPKGGILSNRQKHLASKAGTNDVALTTDSGVRIAHRTGRNRTNPSFGFNWRRSRSGGRHFRTFATATTGGRTTTAAHAAARIGTAAWLAAAIAATAALDATKQAVEQAALGSTARTTRIATAVVGGTAARFAAAVSSTAARFAAVVSSTAARISTARGFAAAIAATMALDATEQTIEQAALRGTARTTRIATAIVGSTAARFAAAVSSTAAGISTARRFAAAVAATDVLDATHQTVEQAALRRTARAARVATTIVSSTTARLATTIVCAAAGFAARTATAKLVEQAEAEALARQSEAHYERSQYVPFHRTISFSCWNRPLRSLIDPVVVLGTGAEDPQQCAISQTAVPPVSGVVGLAEHLGRRFHTPGSFKGGCASGGLQRGPCCPSSHSLTRYSIKGGSAAQVGSLRVGHSGECSLATILGIGRFLKAA